MRVVANTSFCFPLTVRHYDLDLRGQVAPATLFRYLEEAAIRGSAHFGFDLAWYEARKQFWVIRTLQLERVCAPGYHRHGADVVRSDRARAAEIEHELAAAFERWSELEAKAGAGAAPAR